MTFDEFKYKVVADVKVLLKSDGYDIPVCVDDLNEYYLREDHNGAVEHAHFNTLFWES